MSLHIRRLCQGYARILYAGACHVGLGRSLLGPSQSGFYWQPMLPHGRLSMLVFGVTAPDFSQTSVDIAHMNPKPLNSGIQVRLGS